MTTINPKILCPWFIGPMSFKATTFFLLRQVYERVHDLMEVIEYYKPQFFNLSLICSIDHKHHAFKTFHVQKKMGTLSQLHIILYYRHTKQMVNILLEIQIMHIRTLEYINEWWRAFMIHCSAHNSFGASSTIKQEGFDKNLSHKLSMCDKCFAISGITIPLNFQIFVDLW